MGWCRIEKAFLYITGYDEATKGGDLFSTRDTWASSARRLVSARGLVCMMRKRSHERHAFGMLIRLQSGISQYPGSGLGGRCAFERKTYALGR